MDATEHQYRSGEAQADLFAAVGGCVSGALLLWTSPDMREVALLCMAFAGHRVWRAIRAWRTPYVQLSGARLVVFEQGRPKHYVELAAVAAVRQGFNRTVLLMRDGMKISVSHLGFMSSDDARDFRQRLAARFEKGVS